MTLLLLSLLLPLAARADAPPPPVAPHVDLERYLGTWYDVAHLPAPFQRGCHATTATYERRDDGRIQVINRCRKGGLDGRRSEARAKAWVVDEETGAKLKVQFFWPFKADYWILAVDDDYRWALVGTPDRKYLWILSRTPALPPEVEAALVEQARGLGYAVDRLEHTVQPG